MILSCVGFLLLWLCLMLVSCYSFWFCVVLVSCYSLWFCLVLVSCYYDFVLCWFPVSVTVILSGAGFLLLWFCLVVSCVSHWDFGSLSSFSVSFAGTASVGTHEGPCCQHLWGFQPGGTVQRGMKVASNRVLAFHPFSPLFGKSLHPAVNKLCFDLTSR